MAWSPDRLRQVRRRWSEALVRLLGPATELLLHRVLAPGMRVLDVAAGTGGQTVRASERVGQHGTVVATDIASAPLEFAATEAREQGRTNIAFRTMPCEALSEPDAAFDAVISRNGLQYSSDLPRAIAEAHRVLRPSGKLGVIAWSSPERNPYLSQSFATVYRKLGVAAPGPSQPGPFRLGYGDALRSALEVGRFHEVEIVAVKAPAIFESASEALLFQQEAGGELLRLMEGLLEDDRADVWREIAETLLRFESRGTFEAEGELLVGTAKK